MKETIWMCYKKAMKNFYVIEGEHTNPNEIETILKNTEKKYGRFEPESTSIKKNNTGLE